MDERIERTAYPRVKRNLLAKDLAEIYTPSAQDYAFVCQAARKPQLRLNLMVLLKAFQRLGYFPRLKQSKTDQEGEGRKIAIPYGLIPATCPVRALEAWLRDTSISAGPIFRPIDRHGNVKPQRLTAQSVALVIKRYATAAGLNVTDFSGHSLRAGFATTAAAAGIAERNIMESTKKSGVSGCEGPMQLFGCGRQHFVNVCREHLGF